MKRAPVALALLLAGPALAGPSYERALRRTQYLLNATVPTDADFSSYGESDAAYKARVRQFLDHPNFYDAALRYHERLFGTGLQDSYLDELERSDIDNKQNKIASITCSHDAANGNRYACAFAAPVDGGAPVTCPSSWEQPVTAFWYPGVVAWVCPDVARTCGSDLSRCFINYWNADDAKNAELGATEIFDTRAAVVKSLSRQAAGLATAVVVQNFPYTKILEPGVTAVDGAIVHMLRQPFHFDAAKAGATQALVDLVDTMPLTGTRYQLVNTGASPDLGGVLSTYGWLRRYEKDRTRANQLYSRFLCRSFTSMPPRVFPADPGNLRTTPGCMGCHATLDPLADFFKEWGEGGGLYAGPQPRVDTAFDNHPGNSVADLANIIRGDDAFATCTVQNTWQWLMGRGFYRDEADLRAALTSYFVTVNFSWKELVYAIVTHPGYVETARGDATVGDPLDSPPLGQPPGGNAALPCNSQIDFARDIQPKITQCAPCHNAASGTRQDLSTAPEWKQWGSQAINMMASGNMPPGQAGPPLIGPVWDLKEAVRCWLEQNP